MNQKIHFIGIGGVGMGPLAKIFLEMGWQVSGSDLRDSETTRYLAKIGATIYLEHAMENVTGVTDVVYSSAIPLDNLELVAAKEQGLNLYHRSELLAKLLNERRGVAVGGAHGKTTITSMIAWVLEKTGMDPTVLIGAKFAPFGPGAKFGGGDIAVAEADESDRSFLRYHPEIAIVANIEADHLENYNGNFSELISTYKEFLENLKPDGLPILGIDNREVREIAADYPKAITYGFSKDAQWRSEIIKVDQMQTQFTVYRSDQIYGKFTLNVPGRYNVNNGCAAIAVCDYFGLTANEIGQHLSSFTGAQRRFQIICEKKGILVIDDYAHHPTEISATLRAIREGWTRRVIAVFQPHRYSRTQFLFDEFTQAFSDADILVLTDIYAPPPEQPIKGISSEALAKEIRAIGKEVHLIKDYTQVIEFLSKITQDNDLVITMGAGPIWKTAMELCKVLD